MPHAPRYPSFREWIASCDTTISHTGASCVKRDCLVSGTALKAYPYCSVDKSAAPDAKYMVDASGAIAAANAPLSTKFVPPGKYWAWLDQVRAHALCLPLALRVRARMLQPCYPTDRRRGLHSS